MSARQKVKRFLSKMGCYKLNPLMKTAYILTYHKVVDHPVIFFPETSTKSFEQQMKHISENYKVIPLCALVDRITHKKDITNYMAVTIDDGYRDNYTNAFPILKKFDLPATIFLISNCIETGQAPWFMNFREAFYKTSKNRATIRVNHEKLELNLDTLDSRFMASNIVMASMRACPDEIMRENLPEIYESLGHTLPGAFTNIMLTWDQIREMNNHGISFGAHTHTHPILSRLSVSDAEQEIQVSKEIIQGRLNSEVIGFAYPVGGKDHIRPELPQILKKNGFSYAVTTSTGKITYKSNPFQLSRPFPWELNMI